MNDLIEAGSAIILPDRRRLAASHALYRVDDRGGLGVLALPSTALAENQLDALGRFRFAQYLAAGFLDKDIVLADRLDHDVLAAREATATDESLHFVVFDSSSGLLLATVCLFALPEPDPGIRMSSRKRPLFPVEEHFGWGVFNRLALLPDTPIARVREFQRLVKNARCGPAGAGPRAVIELCVAATRMLLGPLSTSVDVCIGEFETNGARRNLEFFHTPMAVVSGGLPVFAPGHPLNAALDGRDRHPFAFLVTDLASMESRLEAIETALAQHDPQGLAALAALKDLSYDTASALVPVSGLPALSNTPLFQRSLSLPARRRARELGGRLRECPLFAALSDTECTTLRTLAVETHVTPGETLVSRHRAADALMLVESGSAELRVPGCAPEPIAGAGDCIGAAGVLVGAAPVGDVVATTSMSVLRFPAETALAPLLELPDVQLGLHRIALAELSRSESQRHPARMQGLLATNTAEAMAALRAAGNTERNPALRNPDHMAASLLTLQPRVHALAKLPGARRAVPLIAERLLPGAYYYETARVKHIDEILQSELDGGVAQLVLLGAGYDSRPYRFADRLRGVRVYELDLPALSAAKRLKITKLSGEVPSHVSFVAANFAREDVSRKLAQAGYDFTRPSLIILSGVTPYLPERAVAGLFEFTARHTCTRSSIAFDYAFREMVDGEDSFRGAANTRKRTAKLGEPLQFGIPSDGVEEYVQRFGLVLASNLRPAELARRYLSAPDGTVQGEPYGFVAIAHARVGKGCLEETGPGSAAVCH